MNTKFYSQSQQQSNQNKGDNMFNRKTTFTTKQPTPAAIYVHNEANFPEFISNKKEIVSDSKPNNALIYADVVSAVIETEKVSKDSTVPTGWTQITVDKKTGKMEIEVSNTEKEQIIQKQLDESTTTKIIKELEHKWSRYKIEYDLIHGENAYHEAHYSAPIYPYLDAELDTDSELSDHSNDYEADL